MERLSVVKLFLVSLWGIVFTSCSGVTSRERPNERGRLILDPEESKLASTDADLTRGMILFGQERLARFCYGVRFSGTMDQQTVRAVREYQKRSGLPVSGNLDPE